MTWNVVSQASAIWGGNQLVYLITESGSYITTESGSSLLLDNASGFPDVLTTWNTQATITTSWG
jgi:hypothetical protein